jgi:xanthine dehydrogenase accessory factor
MIDLAQLSDAIQFHGPVVRVVVADIAGSVPREVGASMLVWPDGQTGTIGGGTLEYEAARAARKLLSSGTQKRLSRHPLGPELGQCCGGSVALVSEVFRAHDIEQLSETQHFSRRVSGNSDKPLAIQRQEALLRNQGQEIDALLQEGWFIEPIKTAAIPMWIWGAGHVGRALVQTLAGLSDFDVTWIDTAESRFPETTQTNVEKLIAENPAQLVPYAPANAQHLIVTYSHALDLELCHQLLSHRFAFTGLIGSKTKWARFQRRLLDLGHSSDQISRITCPIGDPTLGKQPQAIAIGVAAALLHDLKYQKARKDQTA